jgi:hypothetical protein
LPEISKLCGQQISFDAFRSAARCFGFKSYGSFLDVPHAVDIKSLVTDVCCVLDKSNLPTDGFTLSLYVKHGGKYTHGQFRQVGGFGLVLREASGHIKDVNVSARQYLIRRGQYVSGLERKLGDWGYLRQALSDGLIESFEKVAPIQISKLNKPPLSKSLFPKLRENCAFLSDTHFGLRVDKEEIVTNEYNWVVAARRLGKFAEQIATYKIEHRKDCPVLRLNIGGDIGQGIIHWNSDSGTDLITYQITGSVYYLTQFIDYLRHHYSKIIVECTSDNHMRLTHKGPDRATAQKFDNFGTFVYLALQMAFRNVDDVVFHIPKSPITSYMCLGHKIGLTHGDTCLKSGNVGSNVDTGKIVNQVLHLNSTSDMQYGAILLAHVHTAIYLPYLQSTKTALIVNGTMSGTDGFANSRGFFFTTPQQCIWETTAQVPVGDFRSVFLLDADENSKYNGIIKPYEYGLEISKAGIKWPKE